MNSDGSTTIKVRADEIEAIADAHGTGVHLRGDSYYAVVINEDTHKVDVYEARVPVAERVAS